MELLEQAEIARILKQLAELAKDHDKNRETVKILASRLLDSVYEEDSCLGAYAEATLKSALKRPDHLCVILFPLLTHLHGCASTQVDWSLIGL